MPKAERHLAPSEDFVLSQLFQSAARTHEFAGHAAEIIACWPRFDLADTTACIARAGIAALSKPRNLLVAANYFAIARAGAVRMMRPEEIR